MKKCVYQAGPGEECGESVAQGHLYCPLHLKVVTQFYIRTVWYQALAEQLGVRLDDIEDEKTLVADLGADSLDLVEIVCLLEEYFATTLPLDEAANISSVRDGLRYLERKIPVFEAERVTRGDALLAAKSKVAAADRQLDVILGSDLFDSFCKRLGLGVEAVRRVISAHSAGTWIEMVTTVPEFSSEDLIAAHVIILTRSFVVYAQLRSARLRVHRIPLSELKLATTYLFSSGGDLDRIEMACTFPEQGALATEEFVFEEEDGIAGALAFVERVHRFGVYVDKTAK